jgi:hypothetical protein
MDSFTPSVVSVPPFLPRIGLTAVVLVASALFFRR